MNSEQIVQQQLEYYNSRDIDGFMSVIDQEITVYEYSNGAILLEGYEAFKNYYTDLFNQSTNLRSKIIARTVFDNIDHEYTTGRNGSAAPTELVMIYQVQNDRIHKIAVIGKRS